MTYEELISTNTWKGANSQQKGDMYEEWKQTYNQGADYRDYTRDKVVAQNAWNDKFLQFAGGPQQQPQQPEASGPSDEWKSIESTSVFQKASPKERLDMFLEWDGPHDSETFGNLFQAATTHTFGEAFKEGMKNSPIGLAVSDKLPEFEPENKFSQKFAYGAGNILSRLPTDVPAAVLGTIGGTFVGQPELGVAAPFLVTDNLMTAIRAKKLADQGTPMTGGEIGQEVLNNTALGGMTMLGGIAGRGLGTGINAVSHGTKAVAPLETLGQFGGMTAMPVIQGQDVSGTDLLANAALLGVSKGMSKATEATRNAFANAKEVAETTPMLTTLAEDRAAEMAPATPDVVAPEVAAPAEVSPPKEFAVQGDPRYQSLLYLSTQVIKSGATKEERQVIKDTILKDLNVASRKDISPANLDTALNYVSELAAKKGIAVPDLPGARVETVRMGKDKATLAKVFDESVSEDLANSLVPEGERIAWAKINGRVNREGVPITDRDVKAIQQLNDFWVRDRQSGLRQYLPEKVQHFTHDIVDNFHSIVSNAGPEARKVILDPLRDGSYGARAATEKHLNRIKKLMDPLPKESARRIGLYLSQQNKKLRNAANVSGEEGVILTEGEVHAMNELQNMYKRSLYKINTVRKALGQEPIKAEKDYFTAFRKINEIEDSGQSIFNVSNKQLQEMNLSAAANNHNTKVRFNHEKVKSNSKIPIELDAFAVVAKYLYNAERYIHLAPTVDRLTKLANLSEVGGKEFVMHPALKNIINNKLKVVAEGRIRLHDRTADKVANSIANNTTRSIAAGNLHIVASQNLALVNTVMAIGPKYTAMGINKFLKMKADTAGKWVAGKGMEKPENGERQIALTMNHPEFKKAMVDSRVLKERFYKLQDEFDLFEESFQKKNLYNRSMDNMTDVLSLPTRVLDMDSAFITWEGAKQKYLSELAHEAGVDKNEVAYGSPIYKEACRRADETVVRTQAGVNVVDKAEIQHSTVGRVLTAFCNFGINNWNFMRRNILGLGENKYKSASPAAKILLMTEFIALTGAVNFLYKLMNEETPFPDLADAFAGDVGPDDPAYWRNLFVETSSLHPLLASAKFGQSVMGPVGATLEKVRDAGVTGTNIGGGVLGAATLAGIPGATQVYKTIKGTQVYGNPLWRSLLSSGYGYHNNNGEN